MRVNRRDFVVRVSTLLILALGALVAWAPAASAQSEPPATITVTLPADLDPELRAEVLEALGAAGTTIDEARGTTSAGWQQDYAE